VGKETHLVLAGLFVLGLGVVAVAVGLWLGRIGTEYDPYVVVSRYPVSGLHPESAVFYRGVEIGKVSSIEVDPQDLTTIRVAILINKGFPVTDRTFARLRVQPLTGLAQIELDNAEGLAKPLPTHSKKPAIIPMQPSLFEQLTGTGQDLMGELQRLALRLNELLDEENQKRIERILANLETATAGLVQIEEKTTRALAEVPNVMVSVQRSLAKIDKLSADLSSLSQEAKGTLAEGQTLLTTGKRLGATLDHDTLPRLNALLEEMQALSSSVKNLAERLEQDPSAILLGPAPPEPGPGEPGYRLRR
jgi:phospholipid/cholesterol/gamma-HCH transport system substrate-binding protein